MKSKTSKLLFIALAAVILIAGCSSQNKRADYSNRFWPKPPDAKRIQLERIISSNNDVEEKDFAAKLLGDEAARIALQYPSSVAIGPDDKLYVSHRYGIIVFDLKNKAAYKYANLPGVGAVKTARDIAIHDDGRLFIADSKHAAVLVYKDNEFQYFIGKDANMLNPQGIGLDQKNKRILVTDGKLDSLFAFDIDTGKELFRIAPKKGMPPEEYFRFPSDVEVNSEGTIYMLDQGFARVKIYDKDGNFLTNIGRIGDSFGDFTRPKGIAFDSMDNLYVTDASFNNVQIFDKENRFLMFFSSLGSSPGLLQLPMRLTIDKQDRIYIADRMNHRIQIYSLVGSSGKKALEDIPVQQTAPGHYEDIYRTMGGEASPDGVDAEE